MISVILYGRNDSHGYNLPKRAAISLNCITEMLSDEGDEILFVDYNTPNDLPTFIESIYDTLTARAKARLRVFRVRPELHARVVRSHASIGARTAFAKHRHPPIQPPQPLDPATNTDMIFLPRGGCREPGRCGARFGGRTVHRSALRIARTLVGVFSPHRSGSRHERLPRAWPEAAPR